MTVIVNGDITQCDLPRGVRSGLSDALERFEEDEMVGIVRFGKGIAYVQHFANVRYMPTVKCVISAEPGRTGLCLHSSQQFFGNDQFNLPVVIKMYAHFAAVLYLLI